MYVYVCMCMCVCVYVCVCALGACFRCVCVCVCECVKQSTVTTTICPYSRVAFHVVHRPAAFSFFSATQCKDDFLEQFTVLSHV